MSESAEPPTEHIAPGGDAAVGAAIGRRYPRRTAIIGGALAAVVALAVVAFAITRRDPASPVAANQSATASHTSSPATSVSPDGSGGAPSASGTVPTDTAIGYPAGSNPPPPVNSPTRAGAPAMPTNLTATLQPGNIIHLTWTDNSDNEAGFHLSVNGADPPFWLYTPNQTAMDYYATDGATFCFAIRAWEQSALATSAYFPNTAPYHVCVSTPVPPVPVPKSLSAEAYVSGMVVRWMRGDIPPGGLNVDFDTHHYEVRITHANDTAVYATVAPGPYGETTYVYSLPAVAVEVGESYCASVRAFNALGDASPWVGPACSTSQPAPAEPTNRTVEALGNGAVRLTWTDNSNIETSYQIRRFSPIGIRDLEANSTSYTWEGLPVGVQVCFYVRAVINAEQRSPQGPQLCVTPT